MKNSISYGNAHMSPCRDCTEHSPTCHSGCERYEAYKKKVDEEREKIRRMKEQSGLVWAHMKNVREKQKDGNWKKDRGCTY